MQEQLEKYIGKGGLFLMTCTDPEIGKYILGYELDQLNDEDAEKFEIHILDCDYCVKELNDLSALIDTINSNPDKYSKFILSDVQETSSGKKQIIQIPDHGRKSKKWFFNPIPITATTIIAIAILTIIFQDQLFNIHEVKQKKSEEIASIDTPTQEKIATIEEQEKETISDIYQEEDDNSQIIKSYADLAYIDHVEYERIVRRSLFDDYSEGYSEYQKNTREGYSNAIKHFKIVLDDNPGNPDANFYIGLSYLMTKKYDIGIEHLNISASHHDTTLKSLSYWYIGNSYLKLEKPEEAIINLKNANSDIILEYFSIDLNKKVNEINDRLNN